MSIIIPVYNAECTLHRCVDSILQQSFADFELLLIDDGSPDGSGAICDEYAALDSRVRAYHKPNGGVSSARNLGLDYANGEYVSFVDADDKLYDNDSLLHLTNLKADIVIGGFDVVNWNDGLIVRRQLEDVSLSVSHINDWLNEAVHRKFVSSPWAKLLRREIIWTNSLRFNEAMLIAEDTAFIYHFLAHCRTMAITSAPVYTYRQCEQMANKYELTYQEFADCLRGIRSALIAVDFVSLSAGNIIWACFITHLRRQPLSLAHLSELKRAHQIGIEQGMVFSPENYIYRAIRSLLDRRMYRLAYLVIKLSDPWGRFTRLVKKIIFR